MKYENLLLKNVSVGLKRARISSGEIFSEEFSVQ